MFSLATLKPLYKRLPPVTNPVTQPNHEKQAATVRLLAEAHSERDHS